MADPTNLTVAEAVRAAHGDPNEARFKMPELLRFVREQFDLYEPDMGYVGSASIPLTVNPTATDTIDIGATTIEFVAAAGDVADDANVAVEIGGSAAATFVNLLAALNGTAPSAHATIFKTDSATPALGRSPELIRAVEPATNILAVMAADRVGGDILPGVAPSLALTDSLTAVVAWNYANLNLTGGVAAGKAKRTLVFHTVTAGQITAGALTLVMPFLVSKWAWVGLDTTGLVHTGGVDTVVQSTVDSKGAFTITFNGGGADLAAGDVVAIFAQE